MASSSSGASIPFPFPPYKQQSALMQALFECIDSSSVGIFESPTGTGKSLSVICSSLHWLALEEKKILEQVNTDISAESKAGTISSSKPSDDWLSDLIKAPDASNNTQITHEKSKALTKYQLMLAQIARTKTRQRFSQLPSKPNYTIKKSNPTEVTRTVVSEDANGDAEDEAFVLEAYDSGDERQGRGGEGEESGDEKEDFNPIDDDSCGVYGLSLPQIFYCSRTHSQISQFVREIQRTVFKDTRCITIGSRKNLCIHKDVRSLGTDSLISDTCLNMQKTKSASKEPKRARVGRAERIGPCQYHNRSKERVFADAALGTISDIEELVSLGHETSACPYYSSRSAVRGAQVVCMPYTMLLQEELRDSMGINLKGSVVIFDEAHNLVEAVNHANSAELTLEQITIASNCVQAYLTRYRLRLAGRNVYYVNLLLAVLSGLRNSIHRAFAEEEDSTLALNAVKSSASSDTNSHRLEAPTKIMLPNDFIFLALLDNINFLKLKRHIVATSLVHKIGGYAESQARKAAAAAAAAALAQADENPPASKTPMASWQDATRALRSLMAMMSCLMNPDADGRVVISKTNTVGGSSLGGSIKFILLNPSSHFKQILEQARSVVLLGGTMQPFSYARGFLFPTMPSARLRLFSCGHVVSSENVSAMVVPSGPDGVEFDFRHAARLSKPVVGSLKALLRSICKIIPNGIVVFLTSYAYMEALILAWSSSTSSSTAAASNLSREFQTSVFIEPKDAVESERVLHSYSLSAMTSTGAILFCVMGGKMSEGINFTDELARGVVVVGMPFADLRDPILQEKLNHSNSINPNSSKALYEAMCMKVVNQSIGRSIRHANDFASIMLVDKRYGNHSVVNQLPQWISSKINVCMTYGQSAEALSTFFRSRGLVR